MPTYENSNMKSREGIKNQETIPSAHPGCKNRGKMVNIQTNEIQKQIPKMLIEDTVPYVLF